jgi:hypothetical protein
MFTESREGFFFHLRIDVYGSNEKSEPETPSIDKLPGDMDRESRRRLSGREGIVCLRQLLKPSRPSCACAFVAKKSRMQIAKCKNQYLRLDCIILGRAFNEWIVSRES